MNTLLRLGVFLLLLCMTTGHAQEAITLTKPVVTTTTLSGWTPKSLTITVQPTPTIEVVLVDSQGLDARFRYPCPIAPSEEVCSVTTNVQVTAMITTLNTANLTTRSLWRRVFDRLVADFPARFPGGATVQ